MTFRIKTPHAAVKIWNYVDRVDATGADPREGNLVREEIVSTVSCTSIQTAKTKSSPVGTFQFTLAPTRNWTSVITPGSWCVIMMSNEPIQERDFKIANPKMVKMVGRIDTVRTDVSVDTNGARNTRFFVSGQDWGQIFQNVLYVDPLIIGNNQDPNKQAQELYLQLIKILGPEGTPDYSPVRSNLAALLGVFGRPTTGLDDKGIKRLSKSTYSMLMPTPMVTFFGFNSSEITKAMPIVSGALKGKDTYSEVEDGLGIVNPMNLVGMHTFWQVLQDVGNHALNEMFCDIQWKDGKAELALFNRIKPFAFRQNALSNGSAKLRSMFKYVPTYKVDETTVMTVNAGTNWRDKYNFVEIKPELSDPRIYGNYVKQKSQAWDESDDTFDREGFRPLTVAVKQLPYFKEGDKLQIDMASLSDWTALLKEWYFDTHRLLNGQIALTGIDDYITIGCNIMFDAGLIGVKSNYNAGSVGKKCFVLAHVESVRYMFQVNEEGSREFRTVIDFVRGIIVDEQKGLIGGGMIDQLSTTLSVNDSQNDLTTVVTATEDKPKDK